MASNIFPARKIIHLPPPGRPRWLAPPEAKLELLYLSWGSRRFSKHPIPISRHPGWIYVLIQEGPPLLHLEGNFVKTQKNDFFIIHPDCTSGWIDMKNQTSRLLTWVWRSPARCTELNPPEGSFSRWNIPDRIASTFEHLHRRCHSEVESPDTWSQQAFESIRLNMEVTLSRCISNKKVRHLSTARLEFAIQWLQKHLSQRDPIQALCEYQQLSRASLYRLFKSTLSKSPREYHQRTRMQWGQLLLKKGTPAKEIAHLLGYRHPNDFSRAFKKFHRKSIRKSNS